MPADLTKPSGSRRVQRKVTDEELKDIEQKRLRGELSCAECRRLKLKCDKNVPCGSCLRRGCESICPLGVLAAGQGTRFILADTDQLHDKIHRMSNRIRQLEDALAIMQSAVSDHPHPLLSEDQIRIKFGSEALSGGKDASRGEAQRTSKPATDREAKANTESPLDRLDAFGTLTLGSSGEVQYFGSSAGSETLMMRADEYSDDDDDTPEPIPTSSSLDVERLSNLFPFPAKNRPNLDLLTFLENFLPPIDLARSLSDSYLRHAAYLFRPMKRSEVMDALLPTLYEGAAARKREGSPSASSPSSGSSSDDDQNLRRSTIDSWTPHALATAFFIFALGALLDPNKRPYNEEAERWYDLGRSSMSLRTVWDQPAMETICAMGLMATYHSLGGKKYSRDSAWGIMSSASKLGQSDFVSFSNWGHEPALMPTFIDRDGERWDMDAATVQRRRNLFWEVFSADVSHSLALGRPPAIHLSYVDCELPIDDDPSLGSTDKEYMSSWRIKHLFARDIYYPLASSTLVAKSPTYETILELDRKVREVNFPSTYDPYPKKEVIGEEMYVDSEMTMRDFYVSQHRSVTMLYLHRSFFAQAMLDHPENPLLSKYSPSFLTAYRSAGVIIKATSCMFDRCAAIGMRLWFLLYHTFSAAIIAGAVVTRSPNSGISNLAMADFEQAVRLFERAAKESSRAKIALDILLPLQEKARISYAEMAEKERHKASAAVKPLTFLFEHTSAPPASSPEVPHSKPTQVVRAVADDIVDDLAIFGGQTRTVDKGRHRSGSMGSPSVPNPRPSDTPPSSTLTSPKDKKEVVGRWAMESRYGMDGGMVVDSPGRSSHHPSPPQVRQPASTSQIPNLIAHDNFSDVLPEVHPTLLMYLNQDAVKRVQLQEETQWQDNVPWNWDTLAQQQASTSSEAGAAQTPLFMQNYMVGGDNGETEQSWTSFMRDCGIMDTTDEQH